MKYTTEIRKDWEGNYQVGFTIGNQTFYLTTYEQPTEKESKKMAEYSSDLKKFIEKVK